METGARQAPGAFTVVVKKSILGAKVINTAQEDLGKIEDLVIDARNSRVAYAILSFGGVLGLGDKHFAIPWEALTFDLSQKVAVLDMDKDRLKMRRDSIRMIGRIWRIRRGAPRCMTITGIGRIGRRERWVEANVAAAGASGQFWPRVARIGPELRGICSSGRCFLSSLHGELTPGIAFAQCGDVCDVVAAVPGVERKILVERYFLVVFGVKEFALPVGGLERAQEDDPALVQGVEKIEGWGDGRFRVGEFGPAGFEVGLDGWYVLGEREFEASESVHVAVGNVMDQLADGPAAGPVGRVELLVVEAGDGGAHFRGGFFDVSDVGAALVVGEACGALEFSDGVAQVCFGGERHLPLLMCGRRIDGFWAIRFLWMRRG